MLEGKDEKKQFYVTKNFCQNVSNTVVTLAVSKGHEQLQSKHYRERWLCR